MSRVRRVVFDTSTLVSAALLPGSSPYRALLKAMQSCDLCASAETLTEFEQVLHRKKFDRYVDREFRRGFAAVIRQRASFFIVQEAEVAALQLRGHDVCRDPADAKFLALALVAEADEMISGDADLLVLHPWRGIAIMTAAQFLRA